MIGNAGSMSIDQPAASQRPASPALEGKGCGGLLFDDWHNATAAALNRPSVLLHERISHS